MKTSREIHEGIIGKPTYNASIYILNQHQQLCPIGVAGEIYISGPQVAKGYLKNPALTAERFIPNPFKKGEILFKTNDVGRWLSNGDLEFVGRNDQQVKIRGYRIEPGEIENEIRKLDHITGVLVKVVKGKSQQNELAAYITNNEPVALITLRKELSKKLPSFMIPQHFFILDAFPKNSNGKVDHTKLPLPYTHIKKTHSWGRGPVSEAEKQLIDIWKEVLGIDTIGVEDNFFDLGGNSLKVIRMKTLIAKQMGIKVPVVKLYENPNVKALAAYINQNDKEPDTATTPIDEDSEKAVSVMHATLNLLNRSENEE
ncbi:non-ribosomal peptide synthetase [Ascidiimonas aurantiaca]|uniref:non-ribosomal peptide synthetase n=1 Tax=Ascidiimonas aurantiaca TaxID=1685432 RepID=UPI0030EB85F6